MSKQRQIRLAAFSDAAARFCPDAPYCGNEDAFFVDDDLGDDKSGYFEADKVVALSSHGALMVVADGMGGANAGEVASHLACDVIGQQFESLDSEKVTDTLGRQEFLENAILQARLKISCKAMVDNECHGMGTTVVAAWLVGDMLTVSWLGDSRAYLYRKRKGLMLLTEDHSFVQDLVRKGVLSQEETFQHPQGNIITRCLGGFEPHEPETLHFKVKKGDIILLCSDGLSGVLRDKEIGTIIQSNRDSLVECRKTLFAAAKDAGWTDNVTVVLCEIVG